MGVRIIGISCRCVVVGCGRGAEWGRGRDLVDRADYGEYGTPAVLTGLNVRLETFEPGRAGHHG